MISELNRGVTADAVDRERVEELAQELEKLNPTRKPLASPLVNGKWELIYTTSDSILGTKKPPFLRPQGSIYQLIGSLPPTSYPSPPLFACVARLCSESCIMLYVLSGPHNPHKGVILPTCSIVSKQRTSVDC